MIRHERNLDIVSLEKEAELLIERFTQMLGRQGRSEKSLDNLSYVKGIKQQANKIVKAKTDMELRRARNMFYDFVERTNLMIDVDQFLTKSPSFNVNIKKKGALKMFTDDLNVRMATVDLKNYIKALRKIRNALNLEIRHADRDIKTQEITDKFSELKQKVQELSIK